jgi:hypothetical protein
VIAVNPEKPRSAVVWRRVIIVFLVVAALVAIVIVRRSSGDTVVFTVVDARSREPLTNASARFEAPWTTLPVEKLGVSSWRKKALTQVGGKFEVTGISRSAPPLFILFEESNHFHGVFQIMWDDSFRIHCDGPGAEPDALIARTNRVIVALSAMTNLMTIPSEEKK